MSFVRPWPVYASNTPLSELRTAELFVVSSLRLRGLSHTDPGGQHPDWREGFVRAGIAAAGAAGFGALFGIVASAARRSLDVRGPRCARLGDDEAWLLQLVSALQRRRFPDAEGILSDWLPMPATRIAMGPAERFAASLAACGLHLPHRHAEAASTHLAPVAHAARGLVLLQ